MKAARNAEELLRSGEPLLAYDTIEAALQKHPGDRRLRQLKGLALARSGALARANEELRALYDEGSHDGETLGLLARTHKDLALGTPPGPDRDRHLAEAFDIYRAGYEESARQDAVADGYYTGINAATMALLLGNDELARRIANDVENLCARAISENLATGGNAYWVQATLAEATLIQGDRDSAMAHYAKAASLAGHRYGDLSTTRHQARLLLEHLGESKAWLDEAIRVPPVVVYTGHLIDAPGRPTPRFPPDDENKVQEEIRGHFEQLRPAAVYGSAACGADILCLECARELGSDLYIVLPFPADEFRRKSVDLWPDNVWGKRFESLLDDASDVLVISQRPPPVGESIYAYNNLIVTGLAKLRARLLDTRLHGIAVWDGKPAAGEGGTGSVVSLWRRHGVPLTQVQLDKQPTGAAPVQDSSPEPSPNRGKSGRWAYEYKIGTMMFADAVGYSRLTEDQIPLFFDHYAGAIADYNDTSSDKPVHLETAGDGMYMVFSDPGTAGRYALGLSERIKREDWAARGLPADLNLRIGLHCGPIFVGRDPITGMPLYTGNHTSRTARIEPITPPGQVYASSAFAAVAAAQDTESLRFSYVGRTGLAKDYGVLPLYHVRQG